MSARTFHWYWVSAVGASVAVVLALVLVVFPSSDWGPLGHDGVITAPTGSPTGEVYEGSHLFDGNLEARALTAPTQSHVIGRPWQWQVVPALGAPPRLVTYRTGVDVLAVENGRPHVVSQFTSDHILPDSSLLVAGSVAYFQSYQGVEKVSLATGRTLAEYQSTPMPARRCFVSRTCPRQFAGVSTVVLDGGQLFGLEEVSTNDIQVVNLSTHAHRVLPGVSQAPAAALADDGYIYVFAWSADAGTMGVLRVNPRTLQVVTEFSTRVRDSTLDAAQVQVTSSGHIVFFVSAHLYDETWGPIDNYLLDVSARTVREEKLATRGDQMSILGQDVYIFGGADANVVSRVNLVTGAVTLRDPGLTTPSGTNVYAVM